jgi:hypothetical protein
MRPRAHLAESARWPDYWWAANATDYFNLRTNTRIGVRIASIAIAPLAWTVISAIRAAARHGIIHHAIEAAPGDSHLLRATPAAAITPVSPKLALYLCSLARIPLGFADPDGYWSVPVAAAALALQIGGTKRVLCDLTGRRLLLRRENRYRLPPALERLCYDLGAHHEQCTAVPLRIHDWRTAQAIAIYTDLPADTARFLRQLALIPYPWAGPHRYVTPETAAIATATPLAQTRHTLATLTTAGLLHHDQGTYAPDPSTRLLAANLAMLEPPEESADMLTRLSTWRPA